MPESRTLESKTLGDYTLIKQIGQGPLGALFLAEHRFMKKLYAIKIFPEELSADSAFIQRFEEEISFLASLEHPHIVKIHSISFDQGHYFLVTDCIVNSSGETVNLAQYISSRSSPLPEEKLFEALMQIADALDYAHEKKIGNTVGFHRGIKLNNILVKEENDSISLHLSDFGLSKIVGCGAILSRTYQLVAENLGASAALFQSKIGQAVYPSPPIELQKLIPLHASFFQTFTFLAPEQRMLDYATSNSGKEIIEPAADIYAFGILAYYLLTEEFPVGNFDFPSAVKKVLNYNWDYLVAECLRPNPSRRPKKLVPLLLSIKNSTENVRKENISTITAEEPSIEVSQQLRPIIHTTAIEIPQVDHNPAAIFHCESGVKQYTPEQKEVEDIQPMMTEMAIIRGGIFSRGGSDGNRDEMPRHEVTLASFAIDKHPITNEQFVRFLTVMGGEKDNNHQDIIRLKDSRIKRSGGKLSIESGYSKHPVVGVTWYGAVAYAKWVGKRLPTEAEWEIAACGGTDSLLYPTGDDIDKTEANFFSSDTIAVMSYPPNGYGLFDMAGNVYEWCYDWYGYNYYEISVQEPENPMGPWQGVYRVLRGGCWKSLKEDLRCSRRHRNNPGTVNGTYGFRCAADVE